MTHTAVALEDLLIDFDLTASKWKEFFAANPAAEEIPTDIANSGNVGGLAWHLYMASAVHSQRLLGEPVTNFGAISPVKNMAGAWDLHTLGSANLRRFLDGANDRTLDEAIRFVTRSGGEVVVARRKLCLHVFVHAIRHWAQIGPLARQNGFSVGWPQDILFSSAIP